MANASSERFQASPLPSHDGGDGGGSQRKQTASFGLKVLLIGLLLLFQYIIFDTLANEGGLVSQAKLFAMAFFGALVLVQLFSKNFVRSTLIFFLYCGLMEGYLKLTAYDSLNTFVVYSLRDFLLYAVVIGAFIRYFAEQWRWSDRPASVTMPPFTVPILLYLSFCVLQLLHPDSVKSPSSFFNSLVGLRAHVEFIPLYFIGYSIFGNNDRRLRIFFWMFIGVTLLNGIVAFVQAYIPVEKYGMFFGDGFKKLYDPEMGFNRTFIDPYTGVLRLRPPGLGSDAGFSGQLSFIAMPMVIGLIGARWHHIRRQGWLGLLPYLALIGLVFMGAVYSMGRSWFLLSLFTGGVVLLYRSLTKRNVIAAVVVSTLVLLVMESSGQLLKEVKIPGFSRFTNILSIESLYNRVQQERFIHYYSFNKTLIERPFGNGMGVVGPNSGRFLSSDERTDSENAWLSGEFYFLFTLTELGIIGLTLLCYVLTLILTHGFFLLSRSRAQNRWYGAIIMAILSAIIINAFIGGGMNQYPQGACFWLLAGVWMSFPTSNIAVATRESQESLA